MNLLATLLITFLVCVVGYIKSFVFCGATKILNYNTKDMVFKIIFTVILFIALITLMYNVIIGVRTNDDKLIVLCGIGAGLIGMMFGIALSSIFFNL